MSWLESALAEAERAQRDFEAAEAAWESAAANYRMAYHAATRHVVDDDGYRTGDVEAFTPEEIRHLDQLQDAETRAWNRRQRAYEARASAERVLDGGLP